MLNQEKGDRGKVLDRFFAIKINCETLIHFFCFLSVLFIGADLIGVNIGVNLRLDQVFLVILCFLLIINNQFEIFRNIWIFLFAILSLISTILSFNITRGVVFYFSIIYNIIFIYFTFANYIRYYGLIHFFGIFRKTCYIQCVIFFLQYVLMLVFHYEFPFLPNYGYYHGIPRFRLWFYEPSFLANYMIFWFVISCYMFLIGKKTNYLLDVVLCLFLLILSTSTTGVIGIVFSLAIIYLLWLKQGITTEKILFLFLVVIIGALLCLIFKDIFDVFIGRLFNSSLNAASGGRIEHWAETFHVFCDKPAFGVGPGNYGLYLGYDAGYVPSNVTLELMATLGIFATIAFLGLTIQLVYDSFKTARKMNSTEGNLLFACALGLIIFFIILQVNQGYLRLYHWMFFGILQGAVLNYKSCLRGKSFAKVNC